jgi:hypothetical protein
MLCDDLCLQDQTKIKIQLHVKRKLCLFCYTYVFVIRTSFRDLVNGRTVDRTRDSIDPDV